METHLPILFELYKWQRLEELQLNDANKFAIVGDVLQQNEPPCCQTFSLAENQEILQKYYLFDIFDANDKIHCSGAKHSTVH